MDDMEMSGTPWFMGPVQLHAYREFECSQNTTAECDYYQGYWHFWYEADHRFALPTVAFFTATVLLFALLYALSIFAPKRFYDIAFVRQTTMIGRFLGYRSYRIGALNWNSASLGILLLGLVGTLYFTFMVLLPQPYYWPKSDTLNYWGSSPPLATRAGWLSTGCMPFVFLTAGKSNFITAVTGVPHERLQVFHRWISYAFFVTALIHTFPFIVYNIQTHQMKMQWDTNMCYWTGVVAIIAQAWLTFASMSPLRNISYEFFKFSHFLAVLVFMLFFFFHTGYTLSSWDYFIVSGVFFSLSWLHRQLRIYVQHGINLHATVSPASNGFVKVVVPTTARWTAGQHFFIRFPTLGIHALATHPFTACSLPSSTSKASELVFYIRPRGGFTAHLAKLATASPDSKLRVLIDGPYGGVPTKALEQSRQSLVVAGGSGAGWILPILDGHLRRNGPATKKGQEEEETTVVGTSAPQSMHIILATRDLATRQWFERVLADLLAEHDLENLPGTVTIETFLTTHPDASPTPPSPLAAAAAAAAATPPRTDSDDGHGGEKGAGLTVARSVESGASSGTVSTTHRNGRPDLPAVVRALRAAEGQLGVFVCGPLSMQSDVGNAVAAAQLEALKGGGRDAVLHLEHFSWA